MEENKIKGIAKAINKTGILLLTPTDSGGQWWNGLGGCIPYIIPELKGKELELSIINQEKRTFSYLSIIKDHSSRAASNSIPGLVNIKQTEAREPERERIIVRQNAGSQASSFIQCLVSNGYYQVLDTKRIKTDYFQFASEFEEWVFRKC